MFKTASELFQQTFKEWNNDSAPRLAAAIAYYTALSIAPLLVIVIGIVGMIYGEQAAQSEIMTQLQSALGQEAANTIRNIVENMSQTGGGISALISIGVLLVGATGIFAQLQDALNIVWQAEETDRSGVENILYKRLLSFGMLLVIGFLLLVSLVAGAVISSLDTFLADLFPGTQLLLSILNIVVSFAITTLLFAAMYKFLPDVDIEWRDVWVGAAVTTILFTLGRFALTLYLGNVGVASTYGAAGSFVVLLIWVYYSAQIVIFGAEFTQVYAERYGSRITPDTWHPEQANKQATATT